MTVLRREVSGIGAPVAGGEWMLPVPLSSVPEGTCAARSAARGVCPRGAATDLVASVVAGADIGVCARG